MTKAELSSTIRSVSFLRVIGDYQKRTDRYPIKETVSRDVFYLWIDWDLNWNSNAMTLFNWGIRSQQLNIVGCSMILHPWLVVAYKVSHKHLIKSTTVELPLTQVFLCTIQSKVKKIKINPMRVSFRCKTIRFLKKKVQIISWHSLFKLFSKISIKRVR